MTKTLARTLPLLLALTGPIPVALAEAADPATCARLSDPTARLECYDAIFPPDHPDTEVEPVAEVSVAAGAGAAASSEPQGDAGASSAAATDEAAAFGLEAPADKKPAKMVTEITATVARLGKTSSGRQVYYLDNDQVWAKKTDRPFTIREGDQVTIKAGRFGSFSLVSPRNAQTSVERIR